MSKFFKRTTVPGSTGVGCQRQRCRTNENPNLYEFCKNTQVLRVINSVCGTVSKGNCRGNKQGVYLDENNKLLPKRRRIRRQNSKLSHPATTSVTSVISHSVTTSVTSVSSHSVTTNVTSMVSHSVSTSVTSVPSDSVTTSVTSVPPHAVTTNVKSVPPHSVTSSVTSESLPVGKLIVCQGNLNVTNSMTIVCMPSVSASDTGFLSDLSGDNSETEGLWDVLDDSVTTEPFNHLYSDTAASEPPAITWLQHNSTQKDIIDKLLGPGAADEEHSRGFGIVLRRKNFWTLRNSELLNDQVSGLSLTHCLFFSYR